VHGAMHAIESNRVQYRTLIQSTLFPTVVCRYRGVLYSWLGARLGWFASTDPATVISSGEPAAAVPGLLSALCFGAPRTIHAPLRVVVGSQQAGCVAVGADSRPVSCAVPRRGHVSSIPRRVGGWGRHRLVASSSCTKKSVVGTIHRGPHSDGACAGCVPASASYSQTREF
jgi:hypothetical protein